MVRAPPCHGGSCEFESRRPRLFEWHCDTFQLQMKQTLRAALLTASLASIWLLTGCQTKNEVTIQDNIPLAYVDADGSHESPERDTTHNAFPHLKLTGGKITLNDRCPVTKSHLNKRLQTLFVNGESVGFCCSPCLRAFGGGPEFFFNQLSISLSGFTDPARPALLDADHRVTIGYETFFFADSAGKASFKAGLPKSCGILTDPITKERFNPKGDSPSLTYNDRVYYFSTEANREKFNKMPDMYDLPYYDMLPKDTTQNTKSGT